MTEIDRAEKKAMACLNGWVDAMMPQFNAIEMQVLKQRMTANFREYETKIEALEGELKVARERLGPAGYRIITEVAFLRMLLVHCDKQFELLEPMIPAVNGVRQSIAKALEGGKTE